MNPRQSARSATTTVTAQPASQGAPPIKRLSPRQREALELVQAGRVQYGHEHPNMARRGHSTFPVFLIEATPPTDRKAAPSAHWKNTA